MIRAPGVVLVGSASSFIGSSIVERGFRNVERARYRLWTKHRTQHCLYSRSARPDRKGLGACPSGGGDSSSSVLGPPHPAADLLRRRFGGFVAAALLEVVASFAAPSPFELRYFCLGFRGAWIWYLSWLCLVERISRA